MKRFSENGNSCMKFDKTNRFVSIFSLESGKYIRTGILDHDGKDTNVDPFMAEMPELIDVGIMGHCEHGKSGLCVKAGIQCYQSGLKIQRPNMLLNDYKRIIDDTRDYIFQVALGGRGDPDMHENIVEICKYSREKGVVPNFTSSGFGLTEEKVISFKDFVGAMAISWYRSDYTIKAIELLQKHDVMTNIHYVLGNNSIDEAIERLEKNLSDEEGGFPSVNNIIFLLHKPIGMGTRENVLDVRDAKVKRFFEIVDLILISKNKLPFGVGFDSCTIPGILNLSKNVALHSVDTCEGARFSCYITSDMYLTPCSFDQSLRWGESLYEKSFKEIWNGERFELFRNSMKTSCPSCTKRNECMGGCPIVKEIVLCEEINP